METLNTNYTNIEYKYQPYLYINHKFYDNFIQERYKTLNGFILAREDRRVYGDDDNFELIDELILGVLRGLWNGKKMYEKGDVLKIDKWNKCGDKEFWIDKKQYYKDQITTCRENIKKIKALLKEGMSDEDTIVIEEAIDREKRKIRWFNSQISDVDVQDNNATILQVRKDNIKNKIDWLRGLNNE